MEINKEGNLYDGQQYISTTHQLGDNVIINLFEAGKLSGIVSGITFRHGKIYFDVDIFPFASEDDEKHVFQRISNIDSYFLDN